MVKRTYEHRRGFALVAVIWVVGFLTMVLTVTLLFVNKEAESVIESEHSFRAWQLAHSGLSLGAHVDVKRDDNVLNHRPDDLDEEYSVRISSEDARINLNHVIASDDKAFLRNLFNLWLEDNGVANELTDAMVDWVDADDLLSLNGAENDWYRNNGFENRPFNRQFFSLDEVRLVKGFNLITERVPNWRDWFTVHSRGAIDIHEAEPNVLSVAAETELSNAEIFSTNVRGEDGIIGTSDDRRYDDLDDALAALKSSGLNEDAVISRFVLRGDTARIESTGRSGVYSTKISAVIRRLSRGSRLLLYEETNLTSE